jgi:DNA-binding protein YbaB
MLLLSSSVTSFAPVQLQQRASLTTTFMFGGAGAGAPTEDNPEQIKQMENAARALGMSLEEYKLGIRARMKLNEDLCNMRITTGSASSVQVERDANNPPKHLVVTISESGKAAGKEVLGKDIVSALKEASEKAKQGRIDTQKSMMEYIGEKLKEGGQK